MAWSIGAAAAFPGSVLRLRILRETCGVVFEKTDAALGRLTESAASISGKSD